MDRCFRKRGTLKRALHDLRAVEAMLGEMVKKYEYLRRETIADIRDCKTKNKKILLMKRVKVLDAHINQCSQKQCACMNKQYSLEQLEITKLQVEAIRGAASIFDRYVRYNPVENIDALQAKMEELTEDLSDISDILQTPVIEFDEDQLLAEFEEECMEEELPEVPRTPLKERNHSKNERVLDSSSSGSRESMPSVLGISLS